MQVTGVATCHCQLKLSQAEPSRAERPINSCAQLSHLSTQSISHNGNSRQRRLIDRAAYPSPPPSSLPRHALPCLAPPRSATGATIQSRSSIRSILLTDIAFHSMAFQFFTSVQSSSPTAPAPLCNPRGWHRSSACSSQFQLPHSPFPSPCFAARCSLSALRLIKQKCQQSIKYI